MLIQHHKLVAINQQGPFQCLITSVDVYKYIRMSKAVYRCLWMSINVYGYLVTSMGVYNPDISIRSRTMIHLSPGCQLFATARTLTLLCLFC